MIDNKLKALGATASALIGLSILACGGGLGNSGGGTPCTLDSDCSADQVCSQSDNVCQYTCVDDSECYLGEQCLPRGGNAVGNTCQVSSDDNSTTNNTTTNNTTTVECTVNEDCIAGDLEGVCIDGVCDYPTPDTTYNWILISDTSAGAEACDNTDPGSDIMGVRLLDEQGQLVGWGSAGNDQQGTGEDMNKYPTTVRLDGQPHGLTSLECPDGRLSELSPEPFSLGCGGWVLIEFYDSVGTPVAITERSRIEVLEYGSNCGGSDADSYDVLLCTDSEEARGGSDASCSTELGMGLEGFGSISVSSLPQ